MVRLFVQSFVKIVRRLSSDNLHAFGAVKVSLGRHMVSVSLIIFSNPDQNNVTVRTKSGTHNPFLLNS
jgi:hypothetical protein